MLNMHAVHIPDFEKVTSHGPFIIYISDQSFIQVFTVQGKVISVEGQSDAFCCYLTPVNSYSSTILSWHFPCMKMESCSQWY